jgi:hypothetical protein
LAAEQHKAGETAAQTEDALDYETTGMHQAKQLQFLVLIISSKMST